MALARVQAKGQMTVPRVIREACGIETGTDLLCVQTAAGVFECHVLPKAMSVVELINRFGLSGHGPTQEEIDADIEAGLAADVEAEYRALPRGDDPVASESVRHER